MFMSGVIEGFYGRAWSQPQRLEMLEWISRAGMNTFIYGPKDDVKVRARWRETYSPAEMAHLGVLIDAAREKGVTFAVAIAPSLDVTYSDGADRLALERRLVQLASRGVSNIVLLFDDIPRDMTAADQAAFGSLGKAQADFANAAFATLRRHVPMATLIFCPTEYCGAFAIPDVAGSPYLRDIGAYLDREIMVFWTGPDIVSETIDAASILEVSAILQRKPVIWDNFHANDYDLRRVHAGPLGGRDAAIRPLVGGIISNPNNEFEANFVAVHTTGAWVRGDYVERGAFERALADWRQRFTLAHMVPAATVDAAAIRLLAEICYQPFQCGPEVEDLLACARRLLQQHRPLINADWRDGQARIVAFRDRIRTTFDVMTELENRDLFYAFHPYLWEAREEVTHLCAYLDWLSTSPPSDAVFPHRQRIHNFYRRGFGVAVQELLPRRPDGTYQHGA